MLELILHDGASSKRGQCYVSISGKFHRILIYKEAYAEMSLKQGQDFDHVQLFGDRDQPDRFWIKPSIKGMTGSTRIALNAANGTRTISATSLLKYLVWGTEQSVRCPLDWDAHNHAAVVVIDTVDP
jgi:hypothetical protein